MRLLTGEASMQKLPINGANYRVRPKVIITVLAGDGKSSLDGKFNF